MTMRLNVDEILPAIRRLAANEREKLLNRLFAGGIVETPEDITALEAAPDRTDRGNFIEDHDLAG